MKTETMCVDALYKTFLHKHYTVLFITPYDNQARVIFDRLSDLISESPLIKDRLKSKIKNPYYIEFTNHSKIKCFTTGARSGNGGASIRGQKADHLYIDESDYMADEDFDAVLMIAGERNDIGITLSSTPTGARKKFYQCCTDPRMHFKEFYFPSMCNPDWGPKMEEEFRATLSESGYIHEVLAEFGPQDNGVFNKEKLDNALSYDVYAYAELTHSQEERVRVNNWNVKNYIPAYGEIPFKPNHFRTMGIDWDLVQATPSILILDYDMEFKKFRVIARQSVPKAEYTFDKAVKMIIEYNNIYNPSYIYCDRGSGDYQLEMLHKYGDEHPETGLKNKVKGWQFANVIDVPDPVTGEIAKQPIKPFMVKQLSMAIERDKLILSPFDDLLHKQLIDYEVIRISASGRPIYSNKNEHFVDCLGLAFLAMALEFPEITKTTFKHNTSSKLAHSDTILGASRVNKMFDAVSNSLANPWVNKYSGLINGNTTYQETLEDREGPRLFPVSLSMRKPGGAVRFRNWGSRSGGMNKYNLRRSMF